MLLAGGAAQLAGRTGAVMLRQADTILQHACGGMLLQFSAVRFNGPIRGPYSIAYEILILFAIEDGIYIGLLIGLAARAL